MLSFPNSTCGNHTITSGGYLELFGTRYNICMHWCHIKIAYTCLGFCLGRGGGRGVGGEGQMFMFSIRIPGLWGKRIKLANWGRDWMVSNNFVAHTHGHSVTSKNKTKKQNVAHTFYNIIVTTWNCHGTSSGVEWVLS